MTEFISLFLFLFVCISLSVYFLYLFFSENKLKDILKQYLYKYSEFDLKKLIKHKWTIYKLRKKYANVPKAPSTMVRSLWVLVASVISVLLGYYLFDCLGQKGGCLGLNVLEIDQVDTKILSSTAVLLMSAPVIFIIWAFRDTNKLREIEQSRKDINLKEFQQLQEWATGNIKNSDKNSEEALTLQVSALHSLRPYLRGELGESFKRGAYEIFVSVLRSQHKLVLSILAESNINLDARVIDITIDKLPLAKQVNQIVSEEWFAFLVNHNFPRRGLSLVGVNLENACLRSTAFGGYLKFEDVDFTGCSFNGVDLSNTNLVRCKFYHAYMHNVLLKGAQIAGGKWDYSVLMGVNFEAAKLGYSSFKDVDVSTTSFSGASLRSCKFNESHIIDTLFIDAIMSGADFTGSELHDCDFRDAIVGGSNFYGVDMEYLSNFETVKGVPKNLITSVRYVD